MSFCPSCPNGRGYTAPLSYSATPFHPKAEATEVMAWSQALSVPHEAGRAEYMVTAASGKDKDHWTLLSRGKENCH